MLGERKSEPVTSASDSGPDQELGGMNWQGPASPRSMTTLRVRGAICAMRSAADECASILEFRYWSVVPVALQRLARELLVLIRCGMVGIHAQPPLLVFLVILGNLH